LKLAVQAWRLVDLNADIVNDLGNVVKGSLLDAFGQLKWRKDWNLIVNSKKSGIIDAKQIIQFL
jgi:hypothetical protein